MNTMFLELGTVIRGMKHEIVKSQWRTQEFCLGGGSTNSVEDRGQREWGSVGVIAGWETFS
jgi:hypothetical protein